ncbi:MAG: tRNA (adenosine(37)-N6)-dimethylallyltransferase MiaA [Atribacterota bacterium]|nr:tRNA (adenosine(37)-N6)-dimethylallyltransferase MiaA [Candidatus Atribacteria bacterium]
MNPELIPCLVGPTASGKTELSLTLAKVIGRVEIIYADSLAVYRYLDIGTAKPTLEQRREVPHHFVDFLDPKQKWSAYRFRTEVLRCLSDLSARQRTPLVVGGTGFYLKSLYQPLMARGCPADWRIRLILEKRPSSFLYAYLKRIDPSRAEHIGKTDRHRLMRAVEIYIQTGKPPTCFEKQSVPVSPSSPSFLLIGLSLERSLLKKRVEERTRLMFARGLVPEVRHLLHSGYEETDPAFQNFTYRTVCAHLRGHMTEEEACEMIIQETNRYIKRQETWFRKAPVHWISIENKSPVRILNEICILLKEHQIMKED